MYTAGPSGWLRPALKPRFRHRIARKLLGDGSVWILVTRIIEQQLQPVLEPAWFPKPLPSCDAYLPVTGLFRVPWIYGFSSHHPVPASKSNVRDRIPNRLPFSIAMYGGRTLR